MTLGFAAVIGASSMASMIDCTVFVPSASVTSNLSWDNQKIEFATVSQAFLFVELMC
jgi:hypothetical protein